LLRTVLIVTDGATRPIASIMLGRKSISPISVEVTMSGEWLPAAARADVPEGDVIAVTVRDHDIALYGVEGEVYATANICPHGHARLCEGFLEGNEIECPLHQGRFDVTTVRLSWNRSRKAYEPSPSRSKTGRCCC
jgi:naphthalene 1,2-dioxygenase ferredoxin component